MRKEEAVSPLILIELIEKISCKIMILWILLQKIEGILGAIVDWALVTLWKGSIEF